MSNNVERFMVPHDDDICITGIAGRFPNCDNLDELVYNLYNGINCSSSDNGRWIKEHFQCPHITGKIPSYDKFDNEFFGYTIEQSEEMDPEERKQLEVTFEALIDAGVDPKDIKGTKTGLYKGDCFQHTSILKIDPFYPMKEPHSIPTRTMYHYDLRGPFFHVDLACASSFGAFHEAVQAIKYGQCDAAIVIGTNTVFDPMISYQMNNLTFLSPTGECRSLSDDANGYLRSEANAALVLQKRKDAKRVYATVLHTISGSDGYKEEGITFPGRVTQEKLMKKVYNDLNMDPRIINYVEAHATGTKAGDPVEMTAIYNTYCIDRPECDPVYLGCLKSNIGHTEGVSGVCALAKACISFQRGNIAPNIHFKKPNPLCPGITDGTTNGPVTDRPSSGVLVPVIRTTDFDGNFCALNSFGFGGANVHSVLRKEPDWYGSPTDVTKSGPRLVNVRGRTKEAVDYIYNYVRSNPANQEPGFLHLLDSYSIASGQMPFRGYFLLDRSGGKESAIKSWIQVEPRKVSSSGKLPFESLTSSLPSQGQPVQLFFTDSTTLLDSNNNPNPEAQFIDDLMTLDPFAQTLKKLSNVGQLVENILTKGFPETEIESAILTTITQLALVDLLKAVGLQHPAKILGKGNGELACAYWFDLVTPESALRSVVNGDSVQLSNLNAEMLWERVADEPAENGQPVLDVSTSGLFSRLHGRGEMAEKSCDLIQTLHALGNLYTIGCNINIANVYPKVKLPLPSSTPSLSPLIQWDHSHTHNMSIVMPHMGKNQFTTYFKTMTFVIDPRSSEENFYLGHKIDGRHIFPAIGYLALSWQTLSRLINVPIDKLPVQFNDVSFLRATILHPEKEAVFSCRIDEETGRFEVKERDVLVVHGYIKLSNQFNGDLPDFLPEVSADDVFEIKAKDVYKEFRVRGYDYEDYFTPVNYVTSDGKRGEVIWRDTMSKQMRENIVTLPGYESSDWLRRWVVFTDAMMQLMLASDNLIGRGLFVPIKLQCLKVNPMALQENISSSPTIEDTLTMDTSNLITCYGCSFEASVFTKGCQVLGLKTSLMKRQKEAVMTLMNEFNPLSEEVIIPELRDDPPANFDDERCYPDRFLDSIMQFVTENWITDKTHGKFLEATTTAFNLSSRIETLIGNGIYSDILTMRYTVMTDSPKEDVSGPVDNVVKMTGKLENKSFDVIIWRNLYSDGSNQVEQMGKFFDTLTDTGYLLIFTAGQLSGDRMKRMAEKCGLNHILEKVLVCGNDTNYLKAILFRKYTNPLKKEDQTVIPISMNDFEWVQDVKDKMEELSGEPGSRIWLIPKSGEEYFQEKVSGVLGLAKSLRYERGGDKIRCIIDFRLEDTVNFDDPNYSHLLKVDTTFNIFDESTNSWGNYVNYVTDIDDPSTFKKAPKHVYLKPLKPGDMSSFVWAESHIPYSSTSHLSSQLVDVYYAPLNFKDVMYASGNLPLDLLYGVPPEVAKDSLLGFEYSGIDHNGRRVFGNVMFKAMATTIEVCEDEFMFEVPDDWSLLEASTVPAVYLTSLYALIMCGDIREGESILIHAGAGGVGLSALTICCHYKMDIFVTVGSLDKKEYLLKLFPNLKSSQILNSRTTQFEEDIMMATNGRGVDVVLNCLAGSLLQASLRCLAVNGRFLEIGKSDLLRDSPLNHTDYGMNQSFIGVCLDRLFTPKIGKVWSYPRQENDRQVLAKLMARGIKEGFVKPLHANVYSMNQAEDAFRYMATGKHIGKCVIQIRDEMFNGKPTVLNGARLGSATQVSVSNESDNRGNQEQVILTSSSTSTTIPTEKLKHVHQTYFYPHKSYIVVGGMGGLGLEVVQWMVERGAKNIVISSRRGAVNSFQKWALQRLAKRMVQIVISSADCTTEEGAIELIAEAHKLGAVGGIINSAAVLNDTLFEDLTPDSFDYTATSKAKSTFFLDKVSRECCPELDLFICFSSISNNRGNPGQTNYNFGNSAMESVCRKRKQDGLHALAIEWGIIGDVGLVMEMGGYNGTVILSSTTQRIESCLDVLDKFIQRDETVVVSYVKSYAPDEDITSETDLMKLLHRTLGFADASGVDKNASLSSLGLDSLMAVELQQIVERIKGESLSIKAIRDMTINNFIEMAQAGGNVNDSSTSSSSPPSQPRSETKRGVPSLGDLVKSGA